MWDPLRGDPRFEKIVASLAPKKRFHGFEVTLEAGVTSARILRSTKE